MINYLEEFPLPQNTLPEKLRKMLSPVDSLEPKLMVEITAQNELKNENREYCHMVMLTAPEENINSLSVMRISDNGVIAYSVPDCTKKGELSNISHSSINHNDYLVASWGGGSFRTYNLSEKVWMILGLSQRCNGNSHQEIVYDDLSEPVMTVAKGQISNEYRWKLSRDVQWEMRNDYLRKYLYMRGHVGVRCFFYQGFIDDTSEVRALMKGDTWWADVPKEGWYDLDIREHLGGLFLQVKATVVAILPEECIEPDVNELVWPDGYDAAMIKSKSSVPCTINYIYISDNFLKRYEENSLYNTLPTVNDPDNNFDCSPSYKGQWTFVGMRRMGRNIIKVSIYHLLYGSVVPKQEMLHAHKYVISPSLAESMNQDEEHVIQKTKRLVAEILKLGDRFRSLSSGLGMTPLSIEEYVGFSPESIKANGWMDYPILCKLARVAPFAMTEADFLNRCKTLHECLNKIKSSHLRKFLIKAGANKEDVKFKNLGNLKLLERIKNILDFLIENAEPITSWEGSVEQSNWEKINSSLAALFINNDLRQADAHEKIGQCVIALENLGLDSSQLSDGYGSALDFVFDEVIKSLQEINVSLSKLLT